VKQSIYSFQNASPELFLINKEYFKKKSFSYKVKFKFINWNFCFRIGEKNLNFIDKYFNKNKITNELFQSENLSHISLSSENNSDFLILD
jgi:ATP-dependent exoDNAse (exonuclease V) beta subunit